MTLLITDVPLNLSIGNKITGVEVKTTKNDTYTKINISKTGANGLTNWVSSKELGLDGDEYISALRYDIGSIPTNSKVVLDDGTHYALGKCLFGVTDGTQNIGTIEVYNTDDKTVTTGLGKINANVSDDTDVGFSGMGSSQTKICGDFVKISNISVNHQLLHKNGAEYYIGRPKTEKGKRDIPMTATVCNSMKNIIKNSGRVGADIIVDGYSGFIMLDKKGNLQRGENINRVLRKIVDEYNISHEDNLPKITAHIFRHTFCRNMVVRGINVKTLQYLMRHSSSEVTLDVYSHIAFEDAREELNKVIEVNFRKPTAV